MASWKYVTLASFNNLATRGDTPIEPAIISTTPFSDNTSVTVGIEK